MHPPRLGLQGKAVPRSILVGPPSQRTLSWHTCPSSLTLSTVPAFELLSPSHLLPSSMSKIASDHYILLEESSVAPYFLQANSMALQACPEVVLAASSCPSATDLLHAQGFNFHIVLQVCRMPVLTSTSLPVNFSLDSTPRALPCDPAQLSPPPETSPRSPTLILHLGAPRSQHFPRLLCPSLLRQRSLATWLGC